MPTNLLNHINSPKDLRKLTQDQLPDLAVELRNFVIDAVSSNGGHLGANLGVVELTIALHYVFDTPNDMLVWDVGHQAYIHKILTGRRIVFDTNRKFNGISGFPKRSESIFDAFGVGHSSTSISAALGMAIASSYKGLSTHHIAVIGDASIASGMAFEALNHAGTTNVNLIVVLNDNAIGIDPSVGALKDYFRRLKSFHDDSCDTNFFESLNFNYTGVIDGHNLTDLISELNRLKDLGGVHLLHISTLKGKGLRQAEENQVQYHAPGKFDKVTGDVIVNEVSSFTKFQDVFGHTMVDLASLNDDIVAITPAMLTGSSLTHMKEVFPERTFDVGIAEQHAVTFAAGLATQGLIPFCNVYSSFMQRAYDQIIHDVALQNLPVIFCLDRAGLVGADGATHHGVFDLAYLRLIPNITIVAPRNEIELRNILYTAQLGLHGPIAIRYPRGFGKITQWRLPFKQIELGKGLCLTEGEDIAILSVGTIADNVSTAIGLSDKKVAHFDMRFVKPLDIELLHQIFTNYNTIITIEDGVVIGGFGSSISEFASANKYTNSLHLMGLPDNFVEHGTISQLQKKCGIDVDSILKIISQA